MWRCPGCDEKLPDEIVTCWICGTQADGTSDPDFAAESPPPEPELVAPVEPLDLPPLPPEKVREMWIEVAVVSLIVIVPDLWGSIAAIAWEWQPETIAQGRSAVLVRSFSVSALVLYLLWRSGDRWACFGLARPRVSDVAVGLVIAAAVWFVHGLGSLAVWNQLPEPWQESAREWDERGPKETVSAAGWVLVVVTELANGFAEELSMRAYLFLRLRQLLRSTSGALFLSAALFASYHIYHGPWGCFSVLIYGVLMGVAFLVVRRLWPIALAHAVGNLHLALT